MTRTFRRLFATLFLLGPVTATAETSPVLTAALNGLTDTPPALGSAFAACIVGDGDPETTAALFTDAGWVRQDDDEMGVVELSADPAFYVTLYDAGRICSVGSSADSTHKATFTLQTLANFANLPTVPIPDELDCTAFSIGDTARAYVSGGGQDPVCDSDTDSEIRFTFTRLDQGN